MNTKKLLKVGVSLGLFCLVLMPIVASATDASKYWGGGTDYDYGSDITTTTGLGDKDPIDVVINIINIILGLLGIAAVIIILIGGIKWMTAGGNEDKVGEAKKWISRGVIGLVIILAAYGIANFVIERLVDATKGI